MKILSRFLGTAAGIGQILLILVWLIVGAAGTALFLFLLELGAVFFYGIDWWILGAILRIAQWVVGIPAAIALLLGVGFCLFYLGKALIVGRTLE